MSFTIILWFNCYDYHVSIIDQKIILRYLILQIVNKDQSMGFWGSFYLNVLLIIGTLTLGTLSLAAEEEGSVQEEKVTVQKLFLARDPAPPSAREQASVTTQNQPNRHKKTSPRKEEEPLDFSDTGRSGQQTAGETRRGNCPEVSFPLTALVPSSNFGKTIATHPKLWFYVPYSTKDIDKIEFVIQDADRNDISRQTWQPQNIPGYISTSLPEIKPALEISKSYRWYFKVYCQQDGTSAPLFVQGWIEKSEVNEDLSRQVQQEQSPHMIYARNNLWFDAINSFLNYYLIAPNNSAIRADWEKLIKAKGADLELPKLETTNLFVRQN